MTTATSSATFAQDTYAHMQAWVGELCGQLIACGLQQTNDSGQLTLSGSGASTVASWASAALPTGTGVGNSVAYICFTLTDTLAKGSLSTTALRSGGSGYTSTSYTNITVTGVTSGATNARASLTVSGGVAGNLTITTAGSGYVVGEQLTVTGIGAGTGANWTAAALSSGSPVIFRLDFGGGSSTTNPQMWINVGAGTNGSGTIAGTAVTSKMTQVACFAGVAPSSLVTPFTSWFCYNSTYGIVDCLSKSLGTGLGTGLSGGFILARTNDTSGNATGTAAILITNSATATGSSTAAGTNIMQCMTWSSGAGSTVYGLTNLYSGGGTQGGSSTAQTAFGLSTTLENSTVFVFPIMTIDPSIKYNAYMGNVMITDAPVGNTFSTTIIGSTPLTFLAFGSGFGINSPISGQGANGGNLGSCVVFQ
jgi:hypothetical protein